MSIKSEINKHDPLLLDFSGPSGVVTLVKTTPPKNGFSIKSCIPKDKLGRNVILKKSRPLCESNGPKQCLDYTTIYQMPWELVPKTKTEYSNGLYSHHLTINPIPNAEYIVENDPQEHLDQFDYFLQQLRDHMLYKRLLCIYENEEKKLHFHILLKTEKIRDIINIAQKLFATYTHKHRDVLSRYAVISKTININSYKQSFLNKIPLRERKLLFNKEVSYIQDTYFTKEKHNKTHAYVFSEYKK